MPNVPRPFRIIDWERKARNYDTLVFDTKARGAHFPLIWDDPSKHNFDQVTFGLYSYIGDPRLGPNCGDPANHEALATMGSVLGASLVGIDKTRQPGRNYVRMLHNYFNRDTGLYIVTNRSRLAENTSFWYDLYPNILFFALADLYPFEARMPDIMWVASDRFYRAVQVLDGDYWHTAFDFKEMTPVDNGIWVEPHASAGLGWLQYAAYRRFLKPRFLHAADSAIGTLSRERSNPTYEALLPWGAYTAACLNAEHGRRYDLDKILNWCFAETSAAREGWGVICDRWGNYDVHGLVGSNIDFWGGYAFAMNTFNMAIPLVPMVRYAPSFARSIGKWMLNAVNASRLFYPGELPAQKQTCAHLREETRNAIAYEAIAKKYDGQSPYAMGDPSLHGWAETDFCLYGAGLCGVFGSLVKRTNHDKILQIDCLKTDFFGPDAYPTYLYFNPYQTTKSVEINVGPRKTDIYNMTTRTFLASAVRHRTTFEIPPNSAALIVLTPTDGVWSRNGNRLCVNGITVDFQ